MARAALVRVRPMRPSDLEPISLLEADAFAYLGPPVTGTRNPLRPRSRAHMEAALWKDPDGCFVAEQQGGERVGAVFSTTWGKVGWMGYLSVRPDVQGCRVGTQLVRRSVMYLSADPARVVGLETSPERIDNVGFYASLGFRLGYPTLFLRREFSARGPEPLKSDYLVYHWSHLSRHEKRNQLRHLLDLTSRLKPSLDWSKEILACERFGLGDTLCFSDEGRLIGFCVMHLLPMRGLDDEPAYVHVGAFSADRLDAQALPGVMRWVEQYAANEGKRAVQMAVSSARVRTIETLLCSGFRVVRVMLRFVRAALPFSHEDPNTIVVSHWSG